MQGLDIMGLKERPHKDDNRVCSGDVWRLQLQHMYIRVKEELLAAWELLRMHLHPGLGPAMDA